MRKPSDSARSRRAAFGAVLMNGVKRGLFSNEAGSGSAPCAAAAADESDPVKVGLVQALGVFIDTIVICSCTAMIMLLVPEELTTGLAGMDLLQKVMSYYMGEFGVVFIAVTLALFSFSTFLGILSTLDPTLRICSEIVGLSDTLQDLCFDHAVRRRTAGVHGGVGSRRRGRWSYDGV